METYPATEYAYALKRIQSLEQENERLRGALGEIERNAKTLYDGNTCGQKQYIRVKIIEIAQQALGGSDGNTNMARIG